MDLSLFSSSEIGPIPPQHQVFINFEGVDQLRNGFIKILVQALKRQKVNVFVDEEAIKSEDPTNLFNKIDESKIALTIFTKSYASSSLCLDELVKIKERMDQGKLRVIPIFFNVEPDDVKDLGPNFGDCFRDLRSKYPGEPKKPAKWKESLKSISRNFGLHLGNSKQRDFVKSITEEVNKVLLDISKIEKEEEELIRKTKEIQELAKGKPSYLLAFLAHTVAVAVIYVFLDRSITNQK